MNFPLIMFVLLVITGAVWLAEIYFFRPRRDAAANAAVSALEVRAGLPGEEKHEEALQRARRELQESHKKPPWWIEYAVSFFPVILIVFLLRSFLVEPFKIPSGSMLPTLLIGDFILVNKYTYGVRIPIINWKVADINKPQRGAGRDAIQRRPGPIRWRRRAGRSGRQRAHACGLLSRVGARLPARRIRCAAAHDARGPHQVRHRDVGAAVARETRLQ